MRYVSDGTRAWALYASLLESTPLAGEQLSLGACFVGRFALENTIGWDVDAMAPSEITDRLALIGEGFSLARSIGHPAIIGPRGELAQQSVQIIEAVQQDIPPGAIMKQYGLAPHVYRLQLARAHRYGGLFYQTAVMAHAGDPRLGAFTEADAKLDALQKGGMSRADAALALCLPMKSAAWIELAFGESRDKKLAALRAESAQILQEALNIDPLDAYLRTTPPTFPKVRRAQVPAQRKAARTPAAVAPKTFGPRQRREPLLRAEDEVMLAKRIEAGLMAGKVIESLKPNETSTRVGAIQATLEDLQTIQREGKEAFDRFLRANTGLVGRFLRSAQVQSILKSEGLQLTDDLSDSIVQQVVSDHRTGLWHAIEKFDFKKGFKFSTFAYNSWIRRSVYGALAIELDYSLCGNDFEALQRVRRHLRGNEAYATMSDNERAKLLALPPSKLRELEAIARHRKLDGIASLDAPIGSSDDETFTLGDSLSSQAPPETPENTAAKPHIEQAFKKLSEGELTAVMHSFGFIAPHLTDAELAKKFGCSTATIWKARSRGMAKIKKYFETQTASQDAPAPALGE